MAAETINIFGRPVNRKVVYFGGAAAAGFVAYAWWTRAPLSEAPAEPEEELPEPVPEPTDDPGFTVGGGTPLVTNGDWYSLVLEKLQISGLQALAISSAIGKFLARQPLTLTEQGIVQQALAAAGPPPQGGPWYIIPTTSGQNGPPAAPPLPKKPAGIRTSANEVDVTIRWAPVPGAKAYAVDIIAGAGTGRTVLDQRLVPSTVYQFSHSGRRLTPDRQYRYYVSAINTANKPGPQATGTFRTKRQATRRKASA